jgi:hypothetical protein
LAKHGGDGGRRDVDAEFQELSPDPEVAPPGVLSTESKDQVLDRGVERRATGPGPAAATPSARELSVPPGECRRAHEEARSPVPRQQMGGGGQERSVGIGEARSHPSSTEDLQLVAEHVCLQLPLIDATAQEQSDQASDQAVAHRHEHPERF